MSYKTPAASNTTHGVMSTDTYDFDVTNGVVKQREGVKTYFVGKHGNDAADGLTFSSAKLTIQSAVTAAGSDACIYVYPGTYTETITHAASNVSVFGMGFLGNVILTQANANVVNFGAQTSIVYQDMTIQCTAATSFIHTIQGSTGSAAFRQCSSRMVCASNIASPNQPSVARLTAAGTIEFRRGIIEYFHTGNGGATAIKAALRLGNVSGIFNLLAVRQVTVTNSGTALISTVNYDEANNGTFNVNDSVITVTDPNATSVVGFGYVSNTATGHSYARNTITVTATNNNGYGIYAADSASTTFLSHNKIFVSDVAGNSYSVYVGATATVISEFDFFVAVDGKSGTGTFTKVSSLAAGKLTVTGDTTLEASTDRGITIGRATSPLEWVALTNGQLPIGSTGANPVAATLTAGSNISITNAAGSITIASTSTGSPSTLTTATAYTDFTEATNAPISLSDGAGWWVNGNFTYATASVTHEAGHPGMCCNGSTSYIYCISGYWNNGSGSLSYKVISRRKSAVAAADVMVFGFEDSLTTNAIHNGIYFRYTDANANYFAVTEIADSETTTDTGVPPETTWKEFNIEVNAAGTQALFYINGNLVATHVANMPANATKLFGGVFAYHIDMYDLLLDSCLVNNVIGNRY